MIKYYTKEFTETFFETIGDWINSFEGRKAIESYDVIPGHEKKGSLIIVTISVLNQDFNKTEIKCENCKRVIPQEIIVNDYTRDMPFCMFCGQSVIKDETKHKTNSSS
jgi:hypothetical protein